MKISSAASSFLIGSMALALGACSTTSSSSTTATTPPAAVATPAQTAPTPIASSPTFAASVPDATPAGVAAKPATSESAVADAKIDFDSQVKPFFSTYCFQCHGPARQTRGIRFDTAAGITAAKDRISDALDSGMPPPSAAQPTDAEKAMVQKWITEGAVISASYPSGA
ncbi:MAG TPA: hypothetical protein VK737_05125 [Opitutales bacterium]|jgi:uncharacterized membrane protein|nr:hypothetical protein [Opitutales bacterium]